MRTPADADRRASRRLFLVVLGLTAFQFVFLISDRRMPLGHETGRLYELQRAFAGGAEQGTLFQNALLLLGSAVPGVPFLPLFHLGMFIEELLLLAGVWLLGSKHFPSPCSRFVVSIATLGSCLWIDHAALNLLAFSALPLLLYLLHEFLETKSRGPLLLAGLLTILQTLGRPPAFALLVPVAAALYWTGHSLLFGYPLRDRLRKISWGKKDLPGAAVLLLSGLAVVGGASAGTGEPAHAASTARNSLNAVLAGAGLQNPLGYLDFILGLSPNLDATCFCGYFTLAFAAAALLHAGMKRSLSLLGFFAVTMAVLGLLPVLLAALLSLPVPSRPPTQGVPLVRMFVIFLAGFGFERMLELRAVKSRIPGRVAAGMLLVSAALAALFVFNPGDDSLIDHTADVLTLRTPAVAVSPFLSQSILFRDLIATSALMSGLAGGTLLLWASGWRRAPLALALLLLLHPLDVFGWKFRMTWLKSSSVSTTRASGQKPEPLTVETRRTPALLPPSPAFLEGPYGAGSTPLFAAAPAKSRSRSPFRNACSWGLGLLSIFMIGRILRAVAVLARGKPG
jgi:hypothetical protein